MTVQQFHQMVNQESGLLGISETSSDLRDLLGREATSRVAVCVMHTDEEVVIARSVCRVLRPPN